MHTVWGHAGYVTRFLVAFVPTLAHPCGNRNAGGMLPTIPRALEKGFVAHTMDHQPPAAMHNDIVQVVTATRLSRDAQKLSPFCAEMGLKLCRRTA